MTLTDLQNSPKAVLTVADVARLLELDQRTVRRAMVEGDLPCVRVGRRMLAPRLAALRLLGGEGVLPPSAESLTVGEAL